MISGRTRNDTYPKSPSSAVPRLTATRGNLNLPQEAQEAAAKPQLHATIGAAATGGEIELSELLGRKADLRTAEDLSRFFRDEVVRNAVVQHVA